MKYISVPIRPIYGGTGKDTSAETGNVRLDVGTWSFTDEVTVAHDTWVRSLDSAGTGYIGLVKTKGVGGVVVVGAAEGTDGTLWLASDNLNSGDSVNGDVILGYNKHYRSTDSTNAWTRKLIGLETVGAQPDVVVIGDNSIAFAVGTLTCVTNTPGGSLAFANNRGVRGENAAGTDTANLVKLDTSDRVQLGDSTYCPAIPVVATALLPAAAAAMDGVVLIEDAGVGSGNLIAYKGGQRFRFTGTSF
jgi:hypothetical protein